MSNWRDAQTALADAVDAPEGTPAGIASSSAAARFNIYRNNVAVALIEALRGQFPVTERLAGAQGFTILARAFSAHHKPKSPMLFEYGTGFGDFLAAEFDMTDTPFLPDMARLEEACFGAYHAADAEPLRVEDLAALAPDDLAATRLEVHPSLNLVASDYPVATIWALHQTPDDPSDLTVTTGETVVVVRPQADVTVIAIPADGYAFLDACRSGRTLGEAAAQALAADPAFDFGTTLVGLIGLGVFAGRPAPVTDRSGSTE